LAVTLFDLTWITNRERKGLSELELLFLELHEKAHRDHFKINPLKFLLTSKRGREAYAEIQSVKAMRELGYSMDVINRLNLGLFIFIKADISLEELEEEVRYG
jgi:hypothetical protein